MCAVHSSRCFFALLTGCVRFDLFFFFSMGDTVYANVSVSVSVFTIRYVVALAVQFNYKVYFEG